MNLSLCYLNLVLSISNLYICIRYALCQLDTSNPEQLLKATKKGQTLMVFVSVVGDNKDETERITQLWQTSLWNNNVHCDRYVHALLSD